MNPLLDQLLDLPEGEREVFLRQQNSTTAEQLRELLHLQSKLDQEGFLAVHPALSSAVVDPRAAIAGKTIGPYTLLSPIGQGGMGSVWLAERNDGRFERRVAVKFVHLSMIGRNGTLRFQREGAVLGRISHPNIAELIDAGVTASGQSFLVLEYVDGEPIDQYCNQLGFGTESKLRLFRQVLNAVSYAHANLIVHRDIKPSNVLVRKDGQVKLLDFGIAKLLDDTESSPSHALTADGHHGPFTLEYAAPEQVTGAPITIATDLYGLGVLLHYLVTGKHPAGLEAPTPAGLIHSIVEASPRGLPPGDLGVILDKAMKKAPEERYASVAAFSEDLRRFLNHEPIAARPDSLAYRVRKFVRRNRLAAGLAALAAALSMAGVAAILVQASDLREQRDFGLRQLSRAEAVNDFNHTLLADTGPPDTPITITDLLKRGEYIAGRMRPDDPNRTELLFSIGRNYYELDEDANSRRVLEQAYQLAQGLAEPSTRATAACMLAGTLARQGELPRADALIKEGMSLLPDQTHFLQGRIACLSRASEVAGQRGDGAEAVARSREAQQLLRRSPTRSRIAELRALMNLAEAHRSAGETENAVTSFREAAVQLSALGRDDTETASTLYNNLGMALLQLGKTMEAAATLEKAIQISSKKGLVVRYSPMLMLNYASAISKLDRWQESREFAERALAGARTAGDDVVTNQTLLTLSNIYRHLGDLQRATQCLDTVEPRLRRALPAGHIAFAGIALQRAGLAQDAGHLSKALEWVGLSFAMTVKIGKDGESLMPDVLLTRSEIHRLSHRPDPAVVDANAALALLEPGGHGRGFSRRVGLGYMALGRALQDQGEGEKARVAFQSALQHFENAMGPNHSETTAARRLAFPAPR